MSRPRRPSHPPPPKVAAEPGSEPGPGRDTRAGATRTHQLLQVLFRKLRVTVSLLLELVPGGFGHHHHPGRAEAAVGAAAAARQLARVPVPQVPPAVTVTAETRPRGGASRARPTQCRCPAARHATTAAQQETSVTSHRRPGSGCSPGLLPPLRATPASVSAPGGQRLSAGPCVARARRGTCPDVDGGGENRPIGGPERPREGKVGGEELEASGRWVVFVWVSLSIHACAVAASPRPGGGESDLQLHPFLPNAVCALTQANTASQSEPEVASEAEELRGLAAAREKLKFYLMLALPQEQWNWFEAVPRLCVRF